MQHHDRRAQAFNGGTEPALTNSEVQILVKHIIETEGCSWRDLGKACKELIGREINYSTLYGYAELRETRKELIEREKEEGRKALRAYEPTAIQGLIKRLEFLGRQLDQIENSGKLTKAADYLKLSAENRHYLKLYADLNGPIELEGNTKPEQPESEKVENVLEKLAAMVKDKQPAKLEVVKIPAESA